MSRQTSVSAVEAIIGYTFDNQEFLWRALHAAGSPSETPATTTTTPSTTTTTATTPATTAENKETPNEEPETLEEDGTYMQCCKCECFTLIPEGMPGTCGNCMHDECHDCEYYNGSEVGELIADSEEGESGGEGSS